MLHQIKGPNGTHNLSRMTRQPCSANVWHSCDSLRIYSIRYSWGVRDKGSITAVSIEIMALRAGHAMSIITMSGR